MNARRWILFWLIALLIAAVLRYLLPGRYGVALDSGGVTRGVPINIVGFWLILGIAGGISLGKLFIRLVQK